MHNLVVEAWQNRLLGLVGSSDWYLPIGVCSLGIPLEHLCILVEARDSQWPAIRRQHLSVYPTCAACGTPMEPAVHHIQTFHEHPELELDPSNLITLCQLHCCHLMLGHSGNWRAWNPHVREDAALLLQRIRERMQ
jgi:hypothetical protein